MWSAATAARPGVAAAAAGVRANVTLLIAAGHYLATAGAYFEPMDRIEAQTTTAA
jgi:hypothetical protein